MTPSILQVERTDIRYLLNLVKSEIKREINCHSIGTIQSFDPLTATASVTINYRKVLKKRNAVVPNSNSFTDVIIEYPMLIRVPVLILNGGGAYTTYPIAQGDSCLVVFCDRDIDTWLELGNTQNPPNTDRMHDLSDAVALVGLYSVQKPIVNYAINAVQTIFGQVVMSFTNVFASLVDITGQRLCQSGFLQPYAGATAPSGWLMCYGQSISKTTYSYLFAVIGYTYGGGGDSFNVPDLRGRIAIGLDNIGGSSANRLTTTYTPNKDTLGGGVGEESHSLTIPELPAHKHSSSAYSNISFSGGSFVAPVTPGITTFDTNETGSNVPHNNIQPGLMVNWIIKI